MRYDVTKRMNFAAKAKSNHKTMSFRTFLTNNKGLQIVRAMFLPSQPETLKPHFSSSRHMTSPTFPQLEALGQSQNSPVYNFPRKMRLISRRLATLGLSQSSPASDQSRNLNSNVRNDRGTKILRAYWQAEEWVLPMLVLRGPQRDKRHGTQYT
jgi:hypothetical protein